MRNKVTERRNIL